MADKSRAERVDGLALAIASGRGVSEAAAELGIPRRTAYRVASRPDFKARVDRLKQEAVGAAIGVLSNSLVKAAKTLDTLLGDDSPPTVRLGAARAIISDLASLREHAEFAERLTALEQHFDENGHVDQDPAGED